MTNIVALPIKRDRRFHAERISAAWQKGVESILETGQRLIEAKKDLDHGEWLEMIESKLPFGERTTQRLMAIAEHPILSNTTHASLLPPSWMTLYELKKLPNEVLEAKIADGTINPKIQHKDVLAMKEATTQKAAPVEAEETFDEQPNDEPAVICGGPKLRAPDGLTVSEACRQTMALGFKSKHDAAKHIRWGNQSYTLVSKIVLLADRNDLSEKDAAAVRNAVSIMDRTLQPLAAYRLIEQIAKRVWGDKQFENSEATRLKTFQDAIFFIVGTCEFGSEITIPHLSEKHAKAAIADISTAVKVLLSLKKRVEELRQ